jgi:hypothetical protein
MEGPKQSQPVERVYMRLVIGKGTARRPAGFGERPVEDGKKAKRPGHGRSVPSQSNAGWLVQLTTFQIRANWRRSCGGCGLSA